MDDVAASFESPESDDRLAIELGVVRSEGIWTPAPYAHLKAGNEIELTADELAWLVEDAGPKALAKLREEGLHSA